MGPIPSRATPAPTFGLFPDAPHEVVLKGLLADRKRLLELTGDEAVAGAQDRSIQGVRQVMSLCEDWKEKLENENDE